MALPHPPRSHRLAAGGDADWIRARTRTFHGIVHRHGAAPDAALCAFRVLRETQGPPGQRAAGAAARRADGVGAIVGSRAPGALNGLQGLTGPGCKVSHHSNYTVN